MGPFFRLKGRKIELSVFIPLFFFDISIRYSQDHQQGFVARKVAVLQCIEGVGEFGTNQEMEINPQLGIAMMYLGPQRAHRSRRVIYVCAVSPCRELLRFFFRIGYTIKKSGKPKLW
jgi:hypothetical protein